MVHPAAFHPLTPGSPAYAMLKVGAIGSIFALRFVLVKRRQEEPEPEQAAPEPALEARRSPHPVSRRKKKRRRRG
jgi:hypothetical protein